MSLKGQSKKSMTTNSSKPHFALFPFLADGHILPMVDMAKILASRGVRGSIITTEMNAPLVSNSIEKAQSSGFDIHIFTFKFPYAEYGLPNGIENCSTLSLMEGVDLAQTLITFCKDTHLLRGPVEHLLKELQPDCIVTDIFYSWMNEVAAILDVPLLGLLGSGFFSMSISACLQIHKPHADVSSDSEPFLVPMPGNITMSKDRMLDLNDKVRETLSGYKGVVLNTFKELEPVYAEFYASISGNPAWSIGPVSSVNNEAEEKLWRGAANESVMGSECIEWLDGKEPNSTVYLSFGSYTRFKDAQLTEIAMALEQCQYGFIWVVRTPKREDLWLPEGFQKRMAGKGLIIREWAPQIAILEHPSVGAFVTHCGWNSVLEGVMSGKPMVTWPIAAEQFYNEKLVVEVLKIGVGVGCRKICLMCGDEVKREAIVKAVLRVMDGEEGDQMRERAMALRKLGAEAVAENGSSYENVNDLIAKFVAN